MEKITISACGSALGSPGPATVTVCLSDNTGKILRELSETIGNSTADFAEYFAVVRGLQVAEELFGEKTTGMEFELQLSNEVVKKQLNAELPIQDVGLVGHFVEIHNMRVLGFPNLKLRHLLSRQV
jgi:ribonuclease HI